MVQNTIQSAYNQYGGVIGAAGVPSDMHGWDADSRILESAAAGFGLAVSQGEADDGAVLGGATFCGITVADKTLDHDTPDQYEEGDTMAVLNRGDIWVTAATAVVAGRQAYYNSVTGEIGASDVDNAVAIAGAKFLDTADADAVARVRLSNAVGDLTT